jgi:hypothetical protein
MPTLLLPRPLLNRLPEEVWEEVHSFRNPGCEDVFGLLEYLRTCEAMGDRLTPAEKQNLRDTFRQIKEKEAVRAGAVSPIFWRPSPTSLTGSGNFTTKRLEKFQPTVLQHPHGSRPVVPQNLRRNR